MIHPPMLYLGYISITIPFAFAQSPGPNKVAFPENWNQGVMYSQVDRHDVKQYRELWATKAAVDAVTAVLSKEYSDIVGGTAIRIGTVLIISPTMESAPGTLERRQARTAPNRTSSSPL